MRQNVLMPVLLLSMLATYPGAAKPSSILSPAARSGPDEGQAATAQSSPSGTTSPVTTFKAATRAVLIDVVVSDRKKRSVRGLTKDDFVLVEDGQPQSIASFEPTDASVKTGAASPRTILLIDEMNTRFNDLAYARYSIQKVLEKNGHLLSQPTALMALTDDGLTVLQNFTRDSQSLKDALQRHRQAIAWRLNQGAGSANERFNLSLRALQQIAIANEGSGARNNVIWISPGFPVLSKDRMSRQNWMALFEASRRLSDQLLRARIAVYTVDPRGVAGGRPSFGDGRSPLSPLTESFLLAASAAGPKNVAGARANASAAALVQSQQMGFNDLALQALASETGGRSFFGRNNVDDEVDSSVSEGGTYYTISYYPSNRNYDGKFRRIDVKLKSPGFEVHTREGYYALAESIPTVEQTPYRLTDALLSPLSFDSIPLHTVSFSPKSGEPRAQLSLTIDGNALQWTELPNGDLQSTVDLAAADFSGKGKLIRSMFLPSSLTIPAAKASTGKNAVSVSLRVALDSSAQRVRVLVRDRATDRIGSLDIYEPPQSSGTVSSPPQKNN